jgi:hypothetical protein
MESRGVVAADMPFVYELTIHILEAVAEREREPIDERSGIRGLCKLDNR